MDRDSAVDLNNASFALFDAIPMEERLLYPQAPYAQQPSAINSETSDQGSRHSVSGSDLHHLPRSLTPFSHGSDEHSAHMPSRCTRNKYSLLNLKDVVNADGKLKWSKIHSIQKPGLGYRNTEERFRHRDCLGREWSGPKQDRYLSATDGHLSQLIVQATEAVCNGPQDSTWARTKIRDRTPVPLRVMRWVLKGHLERDSKLSTVKTVMKWVPACLTICLLLFIPMRLGGEVRNGGRYEPFKYHYWGYPSIVANPAECAPSVTNRASPRGAWAPNAIANRPLRPRYLCFLKEGHGIYITSVLEWEKENGQNSALQYLFIAYTATQFSHKSPDDNYALHVIAEAAARRAGVHAYWLACSCMPDNEMSEDLYRISDVVRGSHSLVIILGAPVKNRDSHQYTDRELLRQWGNRMWTFPEVLLSPSDCPISIYTRHGDIDKPLRVPKRNFPVEVWEDAPCSRQLVDHYESSIILSPLELVSIAIQCLGSRSIKGLYKGDMSYVLMGLLRRRPTVDPNDTAFQAFCRLSLSNNSNQLLERLICLLPKDVKQAWHTIDDFWGSNLWDIEPFCQVVGVGGQDVKDSVILSGAFGSAIRWKSFAPVNLFLRNTIKRRVARVVLRSLPVLFQFSALVAVAVAGQDKLFRIIFGIVGGLFTGLTIVTLVCSPFLLSFIYVGKTWSAQPWLFGFEGYMPIEEIESAVLGLNLNRLKWAPFGSELSRHKEASGECVGVDPTTDSDAQRMIDDTLYPMKIFTIVDTCTMTVTLFRAVRPPVALLLCGSEGGMLRALLCSYDWTTQTLYRESVLRMDTVVLEKMPRAKRFKLGMQRSLDDVTESVSRD